MASIDSLIISYPNFTLGAIIDPEQANQNNSDIVNKTNDLIDAVNGNLINFVLGEIPDGTMTDVKLSNTDGMIKQKVAQFMKNKFYIDILGGAY